MTCSEIEKVLALEDLDRAIDSEAERHLRTCTSCRERHPEVAFFLDVDPIPSVRRQPKRVRRSRVRLRHVSWAAAAALLVGAATTFLLRWPEPGPEAPEKPAADVGAPEPPRVIRVDAVVEQTFVQQSGGTEWVTRMESGVWRSTPSCLEPGFADSSTSDSASVRRVSPVLRMVEQPFDREWKPER